MNHATSNFHPLKNGEHDHKVTTLLSFLIPNDSDAINIPVVPDGAKIFFETPAMFPHFSTRISVASGKK